jgi:uncharacterized membrane protein (DUF485 family)
MQTRLMSLIETSANIIIGYFLAVGTQVLLFPVFGLEVTFKDNLTIGMVFTVLSFLRGYCLRRIFSRLSIKFDPTVRS